MKTVTVLEVMVAAVLILLVWHMLIEHTGVL